MAVESYSRAMARLTFRLLSDCHSLVFLITVHDPFTIQFFTMPSMATDDIRTGWSSSEASSFSFLFRFLAGSTATLLGQVS